MCVVGPGRIFHFFSAILFIEVAGFPLYRIITVCAYNSTTCAKSPAPNMYLALSTLGTDNHSLTLSCDKPTLFNFH